MHRNTLTGLETTVAGVATGRTMLNLNSCIDSSGGGDVGGTGDDDKSPNSPLNSASSSSTTTTTTSASSAPVYSDELLFNRVAANLDLLPRQGSNSSTKTCEVDLGELERDSYSPLSSSHSNSPSDTAAAAVAAVTATTATGVCNGSGSSVFTPPLPLLSTVDNKIYDDCNAHKCGGSNNKPTTSSCAIAVAPSKEEKQRQNEEIVIMETSSISSETGSWESVFPHATQMQATVAATTAADETDLESFDLRNCCTEFLQNERKKPCKVLEDTEIFDERLSKQHTSALLNLRAEEPLRARTYSTGASCAHATADTSSILNGFAGGSSSSLLLLREYEKRADDNVLSTSGCFIDASSLRDEDEVLSFPSLDGHQSNEGLDIFSNKTCIEKVIESDDTVIKEDDDSPTKKLETFHKSFAKCKTKSKEADVNVINGNTSNSSGSSSSSRSPQKDGTTASITNNLSDEEKLWKREFSASAQSQSQLQGQSKSNELRDRLFDKDNSQETSNVNLCSAGHEDITEPSISLAADFDSSDSSEVVKLRREKERRHAPLPYVFQPQLQQYIGSGGMSHSNASAKLSHFQYVAPIASGSAIHNDLSYTTDYSSSSPAPSLVWSEHEQRPSKQYHPQAQFDDYDAHLHKSCSMMPDTPHNSIAHITDPNSSNTSSIHRDYTLSSSFSQQRDSGAYCSDATDSPIPMPRTPKRTKCDEANPILSGGLSVKDFNVNKCESPTVKRRTDSCPIVSGGFRSLDFERTRPQGDEEYEEEVELRTKPTTRKPISVLTSSWIVDMSDCRPERRKSTSSTSSVENTHATKFRERTDSGSSHKSGCGFYVSLENMDNDKESVEQSGNGNSKKLSPPSQMSKSYTGPRSAGFFVNLDDREELIAAHAKTDDGVEQNKPDPSTDKKNIFSMFIDFGEKKTSNGIKREPLNIPPARLSSSFTSSTPPIHQQQQQQRRVEDPMRSSASSTETLMSKSNTFKQIQQDTDSGVESKSLDYKCNLEKPITVAEIKRISQQHRAQSEAAKRHSWGNSVNQVREPAIPDYKRSISLTANGSGDVGNGGGLMSIIDKLPLISKTSSLSVDSSLSPYDEFTGSKSELSSCSNNSARNSVSGGEEHAAGNTVKIKKRRKDVQINETFDKSSVASLTDGVFSKDLSPASTTDTDDLTFQQDEELASREVALQQVAPVSMQVNSTRSSAIIMETILEAKETSSPKKQNLGGHTMESLHATIEKQKQLLETVNEHGSDVTEKSAFVKLSDMDKPPAVKYEPHSPETLMSKSAGGTHRQMNRLFRDDNLKASARPHSWTMMTRSTGNTATFLNITTSVDNLRSLSRIFPNFSKEFSNSLPNDMILDQQIDDYIQTDISADSSLASSFSRSGMDESSISCRQPRRLGEDLLKMFLQEIATDMLVEVSGRRIRAHKCILRSRCQYFAAMLAGNGAAQNVVSLPGYSYSAVHFALCHIYSGASHPPDGISLMELAALADLLGLEGLKEVTAHALKTNYCHNFHKPCSGCIDGILQVLPVALNHALDDLYRKCLRWTCRHYLKVWPTRQFAQLPSDILGRCRQQIVAYLTSETVLDAVLDCDNLIAQLAPFRWGGVCENLVRDIMDSAYAYIGDHFASLIASDAFLSLGHDKSCHIPRLQEMLLRTASTLTADQACRSYQRVTRLNTVLQAKVIKMPSNLGDLAKELQGLQEEDLEWDPEYIRLVSAILSTVEQCLTRQCSRAMRVTAWQRMDLDLRKKIQTLARLTEPMDMKRGKPVGKAFSFGGSTRNQDLYQVKLAIQAHSKRALAQDTQLYKATQTQDAGCNNVQTTERGVQANHDLREGTSKVLKSNSRAHVPQPYKATGAVVQSATSSERNSINTHRRTHSDAPISNIGKTIPIQHQPIPQQQQQQQSIPKVEEPKAAVPIKPRLAEVRPRYLEPRKPRGHETNGPVRSATSSSITASKTKGHHISSSDSSRNSSPAARKNKLNVAAKTGTKSINMSMDSLSSPSRRPKRDVKSSDNERYSDACVDSLAESMKSSMISNTNKTISQESLASAAKLSRSNPIIINHTAANNNNNSHSKMFRIIQQHQNQQQQQQNLGNNNKLNGNVTKPQIKMSNILAPKMQQKLHLHNPANMTSAGSSPSSVVTTKSTSRLSSVSSTNSARDLYKHRSISAPGQDNNSSASSNGGGRRSFLSAKSREILARRAEKNKQQQQQLQCAATAGQSSDEKINIATTAMSVPPMRSNSHTAVPSALGRHSFTSNIPTRRPNVLHLKKTNNQTTTGGNTNNKTTTTNIKNKMTNSQGYNKTGDITAVGTAIQQKIELLIDTSVKSKDAIPKDAQRIESKLERSSTFCKESSDLDMNDLQIVE